MKIAALKKGTVATEGGSKGSIQAITCDKEPSKA